MKKRQVKRILEAYDLKFSSMVLIAFYFNESNARKQAFKRYLYFYFLSIRSKNERKFYYQQQLKKSKDFLLKM